MVTALGDAKKHLETCINSAHLDPVNPTKLYAAPASTWKVSRAQEVHL